jgi:hypothetical protein
MRRSRGLGDVYKRQEQAGQREENGGGIVSTKKSADAMKGNLGKNHGENFFFWGGETTP